MRNAFIVALLLPSTLAAASTLYKCTDGSGGAILYTNQRAAGKSCIVLSHQPSSSLPGITGMGGSYGSGGSSRPRASATPTPGDFPRVSGNEQKARDGDRRAILDKELLAEEQNLETARRQLLEPANQAPDRQQGVREAITVHERNVLALKKEIANLR